VKNSVVVGKDLQSFKDNLNKNIDQFQKSVNNKELSLVTNMSINPLGWTDGFRLFLEGWKNYSSPIKNVVLASAYSINKTCPLALPLYFEVLTGKSRSEPLRSHRIGSSQLLKDVRRLDDNFINERYDLLSSALKAAGSGSTITIERHDFLHDEIEIESGFKTLCSINSFFKESFESKEIKDATIIVVDGSIIEVSEVHHILERSYKDKSAFVIIARHFSDDVSNTLFVNWQSGKTNVIPFCLDDSLECINEIKDICTLTSTTPISKDTGLLISTIDLDDCRKFNLLFNAKKQSLRIILDEAGSQKSTISRKKLEVQLDKEKIDDVRDLISKRISRMTSRNVIVKVSCDVSELGLIQDRAGAFFQYFSKCAAQGVTKMDNYIIDRLPTSEVIKAIRRAKNDKKSIDSIKAVIRIEKQ